MTHKETVEAIEKLTGEINKLKASNTKLSKRVKRLEETQEVKETK